jgi:hypothetical protein
MSAQIYIAEAVTGSTGTQETYVRLAEALYEVAPGGVYIQAGKGFAWVAEEEARALGKALVDHYAARDEEALSLREALTARDASTVDPDAYEVGTSLVILSDEAKSSIDRDPIGFRRGQRVTVVDGPDHDGDYSVLDEDGAECTSPPCTSATPTTPPRPRPRRTPSPSSRCSSPAPDRPRRGARRDHDPLSGPGAPVSSLF